MLLHDHPGFQSDIALLLETIGASLIVGNAKISAVRSLADICFLHVLIRLIRCIIVSVCSSVFKWC